MKVTVSQQDLVKGLRTVAGAVRSRSSFAMLENVLVTADANQLKLTRTDFEIFINHSIDADVEIEGQVALPYRMLNEVVKALPKGNVTLNMVGEEWVVTVGSGHTTLDIVGANGIEFPRVVEAMVGEAVRLDAQDMRTSIMRVAPSASTDDTRPALGGVMVSLERDRVKMVATDGFRLAVSDMRTVCDVSAPTDVLIPGRTMLQLAKEIGRTDGNVYMNLQRVNNLEIVAFSIGTTMIGSPQLNEKFPDVTSVIPKKFNTQASMASASLSLACKALKTISDTMVFDIESTFATLSSGQGAGSNRISVGTVGPDVKMAINNAYVQDALKAVNAPQIVMDVTSPMEPAVFRAVGSNDFIYVVMPMHFSE